MGNFSMWDSWSMTYIGRKYADGLKTYLTAVRGTKNCLTAGDARKGDRHEKESNSRFVWWTVIGA